MPEIKLYVSKNHQANDPLHLPSNTPRKQGGPGWIIGPGSCCCNIHTAPEKRIEEESVIVRYVTPLAGIVYMIYLFVMTFSHVSIGTNSAVIPIDQCA